MKKTLLILFFPILFITCQKEDPVAQPDDTPVVVLDRATVEQQVVGDWEGKITETPGTTENVEVTVEEMKPGEKVAEGRYFASGFECGFEWTYESFSNGRVTFREKTLNPDICFDEVAILTHFEDEEFDSLRVFIAVANYTFKGTLARK